MSKAANLSLYIERTIKHGLRCILLGLHREHTLLRALVVLPPPPGVHYGNRCEGSCSSRREAKSYLGKISFCRRGTSFREYLDVEDLITQSVHVQYGLIYDLARLLRGGEMRIVLDQLALAER